MAEATSDNVVEILLATNDKHGGVIVEMEDPIDCKLFHSMLKASMSKWSQEGKKGVWLKLPIKLANLIEPAVEEGFWYHHAEPNYLMLVQWIPIINSTIPTNASHRVAIGAIVITEDKQLLVVQESAGVLRGTGIWKIPTGVVEEGEDLSKAAVREVKEETGIFNVGGHHFDSATGRRRRCSQPSRIRVHFDESGTNSVSGSVSCRVDTGTATFLPCPCNTATNSSWIFLQIDTEFIEILGFRQSHKSFFEKSDLFFVCFLRPLSFDIQRQELEIDAAQWMSIEEYTAQPIVKKHGPFKLVADLFDAKLKNKYNGFKPVPATSSLSAKTSSFYINTIDLDSSDYSDQP